MNLISSEYCSDEEEERGKEDTLKESKSKDIHYISSLTNPGPSFISPTPNFCGYVSKRRTRTEKVDKTPKDLTKDDISTSSRLSSYLLAPNTDGPLHHKSLLWEGHTKPILNLDWHPTCRYLLLSSSLDGYLKVWDVRHKNDSVCQISFPSSSHSTVACPLHVAKWASSSHVLTGGAERVIRHIDMTTLQTISTTDSLDGTITALTLHPTDSNVYVTGDTCKMVKSWDIRTQKHIHSYSGAGGQILDAIFINNGHELVASSDIVRKNAVSQMLLVWDYSSCLIQSRQIYCEPYTCPCLRPHPYEGTFMAQSNADYIVLFNSKSPYKMNKWKRFESHAVDGYKTQFDVSCDGLSVMSASSDGSLCVYDWKSTRLKKRHRFCTSRSPSIAVTCHPLDRSLVTCSHWNGSIVVASL